MRQRSKFPPRTAAERQAKCRAIKRGEWVTIMSEQEKQRLGLPSMLDQPALPAPGRLTAGLIGPPGGQPVAALPAPPNQPPVLPAPATGTAIQKSVSADALAIPDTDGAAVGGGLSLPPAGAARLRSLLARLAAGKTLTAKERDEAQGLLDVAEFFVVQRLRNRLAA